ncbi:MAG TPA: 16S rRNA (cytidine(1402)-2'-O)-methyltransferase [Gaiellaceae bacterium]
MLAICATPIGNLDDITLRVLAALRSADVLLAEDTRHTRGLLERHGIQAKLLSYHEHNEAARTSELVPRLLAGESMALVSDAGLPGISDPGLRLVRAAREAGVEVTVLPGASAVETALVASGIGDGRYAFVGFLPRRAAELAALWRDVAAWGCPIVAFESPQRLPATLRSLVDVDPAWDVAVCRELTKRFEEIVRGPATEVAATFVDAPRGEITLVLSTRAVDDSSRRDAAHAAVRTLVDAGAPRRVAADVVASLTDTSKNDLYRSSL